MGANLSSEWPHTRWPFDRSAASASLNHSGRSVSLAVLAGSSSAIRCPVNPFRSKHQFRTRKSGRITPAWGRDHRLRIPRPWWPAPADVPQRQEAWPGVKLLQGPTDVAPPVPPGAGAQLGAASLRRPALARSGLDPFARVVARSAAAPLPARRCEAAPRTLAGRCLGEHSAARGPGGRSAARG